MLRQSVAGNSTFRGIVVCNLGTPKTVISSRPPPPSPSRRRPRRPVNLVLRPWRSNIPPPFPVGAGDTCGGIHSEKRKGRKSLFLFTAQLLRKTNLAEIFSEARSGTIAHKNQKRITAGTHCRVRHEL